MTFNGGQARREIPFQEIAHRALAIAPSLLGRWLPEHRQRGRFFQAARPDRKDVPFGSLVIWFRSGAWKHYATDKGGGDLISLYAYLHNLQQGDAAKELADELGIDRTRPVFVARPGPVVTSVEPSAPRPDHDKEPAKRRAWARDIWRKAEPAAGTPVEAYLRSRGITIPVPPSLRFAMLSHSDVGKQGRYPVMVGAMQVLDGLVGVHRTYLAADGSGKLNLPLLDQRGRITGHAKAKMMLGSAEGAAVRLNALTPNLIIAEGIESALSVLELAPGWTVWAGLSAGNLAAIAIPGIVQRLAFVADGDRKGDPRTLGVRRTGQDAAQAAAVAHADRGLSSWVLVPTPNFDPNDILRNDPAQARELSALLAGWLARPLPAARAA